MLISDLVDASFPDRSRPGLVLMLQCYFDDAGTHAGAPALAYGGLVGTKEQWVAFDARWRALLAAPMEGKPPLKAFHLTDCRVSAGEFLRYRPVERDVVQHAFRQIIIETGISAIAYSVAVADWNELVIGKARRWLGSPEQIIFSACVGGAMQVAHELGHNEVSIWFDAGRRSSELDSLTNRAMLNQSGPVKLVGVSFLSVAEIPALQGADIVATESRMQADTYIKTGEVAPSAHFAALLKGVHAAGYILDRDQIALNVERFNQVGPWYGKPSGLL